MNVDSATHGDYLQRFSALTLSSKFAMSCRTTCGRAGVRSIMDAQRSQVAAALRAEAEVLSLSIAFVPLVRA